MTETVQLTLAEAERRRKISEAMRGRSPWNKGKTGVYSDAVIQRLSEAGRAENLSEETLRKRSEAAQGENGSNWKGGSSFEPYCPSFNDKQREKTRNKYGRACVLCGTSALQQKRRLSVHHVDENKQQGCNGHKWRLVPLCTTCHNFVHNRDGTLLISLLLLKNKRAELLRPEWPATSTGYGNLNTRK